MSEKFYKERNLVLARARGGIESNIPLASVQKKYLKNLLLYSLMSASRNETVTEKNFIKLVNRLFKKYLVQIILKNADDDDDDDETVSEGLNVELNKIIANGELLDINALSEVLTPANVIAIIKANTNGLTQRQILNRLLSLREAKANHRETPEEARQREQRQKEYEMQRQRERMMEGRILTRGSRERS